MPIPWGVAAAGAVAKTAYDHFRGDQVYRRGAKEAAKNRQFQERMRNTQWQSAVEDMRAAGINPAIAYSQGPNAAPGGSSATGGPATSATDPVSSAMAVKLQRKQLELLEAQRNREDATAGKLRGETEAITYSNRMTSAEMGRYFTRDDSGRYQMTPALLEWLRKEHEGRMASSGREVQQLRNLRLQEAELKAIAEVFSTLGGGGKAAQIILPLLRGFIR
jgi:hypothetical protein